MSERLYFANLVVVAVTPYTQDDRFERAWVKLQTPDGSVLGYDTGAAWAVYCSVGDETGPVTASLDPRHEDCLMRILRVKARERGDQKRSGLDTNSEPV